MINAGAIIVTSLIKNGLSMADRFDFVLQEYRKLSGGEYIGFNNATSVLSLSLAFSFSLSVLLSPFIS